jgi:hypothetical protein
MNRYTKMYGWLYTTFGTTPFTINDFRVMFPSNQPTKTIHDLIKLHFMKRIRHGTYQINRPEEYVRTIVSENISQEKIMTHAEKPYAYCESTAVTMWTDGYYWTDFTKGFRPIHIQVDKKTVPYWRDFFRHYDTEYIIAGEHKTMFGITYVVHPVDKIIVEKKDGDPVISLHETIQFCKKNTMLYKPAMEFLDKKYHLGLFSEYESVAT